MQKGVIAQSLNSQSARDDELFDLPLLREIAQRGARRFAMKENDVRAIRDAVDRWCVYNFHLV
jgi:hypothetical protein